MDILLSSNPTVRNSPYRQTCKRTPIRVNFKKFKMYYSNSPDFLNYPYSIDTFINSRFNVFLIPKHPKQLLCAHSWVANYKRWLLPSRNLQWEMIIFWSHNMVCGISVTHSVSQSVSLFSRSVLSHSLWPHEPQHARPRCLSPTPGVHPNPCPLNWWCHPTITSSVFPFSSCPQSFPASGSFQMSQLFTSGGQGIEVAASASVLPMNIQDWSPLGWTGWISLQSKGLSGVFSNTTVQKHQFFVAQLYLHANSHIHPWLLEKP